MSIYIPDMEMPKCCYECPIKTDWDTCGYYSISKHIPYKDVPSGEHDILDDCPLISVPNHGRLIDADALCRLCDNTIDHSVTPNDIMRVPTIIPADGKDGAE